jgi:hypothetical protein
MPKKLVPLFFLVSLIAAPCFAWVDTALTILYTGETHAAINPRHR